MYIDRNHAVHVPNARVCCRLRSKQVLLADKYDNNADTQ